MIAVNYIYDRVQDISRKYQSGYNTVAEFNNDLRDSENLLYEFYYKIFEQSQKISDALEPFIPEISRPITNGTIEYPADFRHPAELSYKYIKADPECAAPTEEEIPMVKLSVNEERDTMRSYIRKPSLAKKLLYWTQVNNKIRVRPIELTGNILLKYFRNPVYGEYKTVIDPDTELEVFAPPPVSKNLEWREQESTNIIDLMLLHKGISIRDSDLMQFAMLKIKKVEDESRSTR